MRKILLTALIAVTMVSSAFAKGSTTVSVAIKNSFRQDFGSVEEVQWSAGESYVTASFIANGKRTLAFYEQSGTLIGTSHAVTIDELPAKVKRTFAKKYGSYTVKEAILFERGDETAYFISATNEGTSVVLKVTGNQVALYR